MGKHNVSCPASRLNVQDKTVNYAVVQWRKKLPHKYQTVWRKKQTNTINLCLLGWLSGCWSLLCLFPFPRNWGLLPAKILWKPAQFALANFCNRIWYNTPLRFISPHAVSALLKFYCCSWSCCTIKLGTRHRGNKWHISSIKSHCWIKKG